MEPPFLIILLAGGGAAFVHVEQKRSLMSLLFCSQIFFCVLYHVYMHDFFFLCAWLVGLIICNKTHHYPKIENQQVVGNADIVGGHHK